MRWLCIVLAVALLGAAPAAGPRQGAGPQSYTVTSATLETSSGPGDAFPVTLEYDLYVPDTASAADPRPAMVLAHGFGNTKTANEILALAAMFAGHGYLVLASTHQGFGGSSGCITLDTLEYDGRNVTRLLDVLATRPDVLQEAPGDPVVGMAGGSYGGGHQGGVAAADGRLDAIHPGRTWNSLQFSLVPNNVVTTTQHDLDDYEQGVYKQGWVNLLFASGASQPLMGNGGCDPVSQQQLYPGQPPCPGFLPVVCEFRARLEATGDATAEARELVAGASIATFADRVRVPTLLVQGQRDTLFTPTEAVATHEALEASGADVQMIWNWGGHGYPPQPGEGEPYAGGYDDTPESQLAFQQTYLAQRILAFFDHHLRGEGDRGPDFAWFRDHVPYDVADTGGTAEPAYGTAARYPVMGERTYTADAAAGALHEGRVDVAPSTATLAVPPDGGAEAHSEVPNFNAPGQPGANVPATEVEGQHLDLLSAPFAQGFESIGTAMLTVDVSTASGGDAILFGKIYDIAPDGSATLLRRMVAPARVIAPAEPTTVTMRLPTLAHHFEAGHRVRVTLATTDDSYRNPTGPDAVTITTPGTLLLPAPDGDLVSRLAGRGRVLTAVRASRAAFDSATVAVLARADDFADALASGPLAAVLGGPLLLTGQQGLAPEVVEELERLGVRDVVLAGGPVALSDQIVADLAVRGYGVRRLAGTDRYRTATAIARELVRTVGDVDAVVLARGDDFADALAAGSLGATLPAPIVLTRPDELPAPTAALIDDVLHGFERVLVAGGPRAVSDAVVAALPEDAERLAGSDRYGTAAALLQRTWLEGAGDRTVLFTSGADFPDALAAMPAAAALGGVVAIVHPADLAHSAMVRDLLTDRAETVDRAYLVGGFAALGPALDAQVRDTITD